MNKRKLDSLLWESIPFENFIIGGHVSIVQENLDDVFWDDVDELCVSRDDEYLQCKSKKLHLAQLCQKVD